MRILIAYASKRGGTKGIAETIASAMCDADVVAEARSVQKVKSVSDYDAVVVGSALYMFHWLRSATHFVKHNQKALKTTPVWMFSSGPLDASADEKDIEPVKGVAKLIEIVGARGHRTFGGRLTSDAKGFPAAAMAKKNAGDWRNIDEIRSWATSIVTEVRASSIHQGG